MTSPAGRSRLGDARGAARKAGRRLGRPPRTPAAGGKQKQAKQEEAWFDADPPTEPIPVVTAQAARSARPADPMTWSPPRLTGPQDDQVGPPNIRTVLRTVRQLWRPNPPWAVRPPLAVRLAYRYWLIALVCGLAARIVMIVSAWHYQRTHGGIGLAGGPTVIGTLFELLVLVVGHFVVVRLKHGDDWARTTLALAGGLIAFLVALTALGNVSFQTSVPALFRTASAMLRLLGCTAAGLGIWYMFQPGAAEHFDPRRREELR